MLAALLLSGGAVVHAQTPQADDASSSDVRRERPRLFEPPAHARPLDKRHHRLAEPRGSVLRIKWRSSGSAHRTVSGESESTGPSFGQPEGAASRYPDFAGRVIVEPEEPRTLPETPHALESPIESRVGSPAPDFETDLDERSEEPLPIGAMQPPPAPEAAPGVQPPPGPGPPLDPFEDDIPEYRRRALVDPECPKREDLKRITDITLDLAPTEGEFPFECPLFEEAYVPRHWHCLTYAWTASSLCHKPLYFEEVALERYGHSTGWYTQPVVSGAHFFASLLTLPYQMGLNHPSECVYPLGYYRPGSCAPKILYNVPINARAAAYQAGTVTGLVYLLP